MLKEGAAAPAFTTKDAEGDIVRLKDFRGQKVVLYFYPKDDTPGCTKEACSFRDAFSKFKKRGIQVFGVSPDGEASHKKFAAKYKLPFTLLSDTEKVVVKMYDVMGPLGFGVRRATYLIDQARRIRSAVLADFRISAHEEFVRTAIALSAEG